MGEAKNHSCIRLVKTVISIMKTHLALSSRSVGVAGILTLLAVAFGTVCAAPPEATQPPAPAKQAWQNTKAGAQAAAADVRAAIGDAWEKSKDATFKQRETLRDKMKTAEAMLDVKIAEWSIKKDAVVEDAKPVVSAAQQEVREAREVLNQKIKALDNATEETWNSVKAELNTAWQRMTTAASDLASKLHPQS
jgi:hypothetical protein